MSTRLLCLVGLAWLALATPARADSLELKDGTRLQGKFVGGTADVIRFQVGEKLRTVKVADVKKLVFGELRPDVSKSSAEPVGAPASEEPSEGGKGSEAAPPLV